MGLASLVLLHIVVRVDAVARLKPDMVARIATEARRVWKPYGVDLTVIPPGAEGSSGALLDAGREAEELQLVITDRLTGKVGSARRDVFGLGWIEFAGPEQPSRTITVSTAAAARLSDGATWAGVELNRLPARIREQFLVHALGRAVAHEIGHYLLRSTAHARGGLMRAQFAPDEVMDESLARFRLEAAQVDAVARRWPGEAPRPPDVATAARGLRTSPSAS